MKHSENLNLKLPEGGDTLEVSDLSENFETLDGAVGEAVKNADPCKVGDTLTTWRTDLGENWLLCNGDMLDPAEYPELYAASPGYVSNFYSDLYRSIPIADLKHEGGRYTIFKDKVIYVYVDGVFRPTIYIQDTISSEYTTLTLTALDKIYDFGGGMSVVVDDILYVFGVNTTSSNGINRISLIKCVGDPTIKTNWFTYYSPNTFSSSASEYISGVSIGKNNIIYIFLRNSKSIRKFVTEDLTKSISFVSETNITYPEYRAPSDGWAFSYRNSLYVFTQSTDNTRDVILKFHHTADGWVYNEIHSLSHDAVVYSLQPSPRSRISSPKSSMVLALSAANSAYSRLIQINPDNTVYESDFIPSLSINSSNPLIIEKNGKYAIRTKNYNTVGYVDSLTEQAIANMENITIANGSNISISGIDDSDIISLIPVLYESATAGNYAYYIPLLCTPKISQSTTYTYIKAKEDAPNANQQTDTPAP